MRSAFPRRGGRASRPGSRVTLLLAAVIALAAAAGGFAYYSGGHPAHAGTSPSSGTYGALPSWLPTSQLPTGRVVQASPAHPQLAIEGDSVAVDLAHGHVLATAVGPDVPEEGQFPVPATSPCSFTVTFTRTAGTIALQPASFTILDELGHLHHPHVTAQGGGPLPARIAPGRTVTIIVRDVLPTGSGTLRWAPGTVQPVVSWDFDVEID